MRGRKKTTNAKTKIISIRIDETNYNIYKGLDKSIKQDLSKYINNYLSVFQMK